MSLRSGIAGAETEAGWGLAGYGVTIGRRPASLKPEISEKGGNVMELEISPEEQQFLLELLDNDLQRLRWDSARTHRATFRTELKVREEILEGLLARLRGLVLSGTAR